MRNILKPTKALSNEIRLRILSLLMERECCVCEVMQVLDISQSTTSHNLSVLYDAGFIKLKKRGYWSVYSIDKDAQDNHLRYLLDFVTSALKDNEVVILDRKRLEKVDHNICRISGMPND